MIIVARRFVTFRPGLFGNWKVEPYESLETETVESAPRSDST